MFQVTEFASTKLIFTIQFSLEIGAIHTNDFFYFDQKVVLKRMQTEENT